MPAFSDAHFHSLSDAYGRIGIGYEEIYSSLYRGIDCSTCLDDADKIALRAEGHPNIFFTVGAGPWQADEADDLFLDSISETLSRFGSHRQLAAIGETGLDFHYDYGRKEQKALFEKQIALSVEWGFPLIIHSRDSFGETLDMLKAFRLSKQGMFHCFSGGVEEAKKALDMGFYLSFGGSATYKRNGMIRQALAYCPSDRILLETDSPYLPPEGKRGKVNTPLNIPEIADILSEFRDNGRDGGLYSDSNRNIEKFLAQRWN